MRTLILACCLLLLGIAHANNPCAALTGPDSPLRFGDRIVFHGDSITSQSIGPDGFTTLLQRELAVKRPDLRVRVSATGESGRKTTALVSSLPYDVLDQQPTVVFIIIGVNDVWHRAPRFGGKGSTLEEYAAALRAAIDAIRQAGALPVLATPAVIGEKTDGTNDMRMAMTSTPLTSGAPVLADAPLDEYAAISRKVATEKDIELCDLRKAFVEYLKANNPEQKFQGILTMDGVHLSPAGNRLVAGQAALSIAAALRKCPWFLPLHDAVVTPNTRLPLLGRNGSNAGLNLRYTLDGTAPTARSPRYTKPIAFTKTATLRIRVTDKQGHLYTSGATCTVMDLRQPETVANPVPGLQYALYDVQSESKLVPDLTGLTSVTAGTFQNPFFATPKTLTSYAARLTGYLRIPADGVYTFTARSAFGSKLWIGDRLVVTHDYVGMKVSRAGEIALKAGLHPITITFYRQPGGDPSQWFFIEGPGMPYQMIPDGMWQRTGE
jgi:lysophospholipase L1-like esterase